MVLPFPECNIVGIIQHAVFSNWLLSLGDMHLSFLHGLIVHFFIALNNIPLSRGSTVYLLIHLLTDILVAVKFGHLQIKLL